MQTSWPGWAGTVGETNRTGGVSIIAGGLSGVVGVAVNRKPIAPLWAACGIKSADV